MNYTLKLFNTGQITLPKKWRSQFHTKNFIAEETDQGLLIKPLLNDKTIFYEDSKEFGLYAEEGIDTKKIIQKIKDLQNG